MRGELQLSLTPVAATTVDAPLVVRIYVTNISDDVVAVSRRLALGRLDSASDLSLHIVGPDGLDRPFRARIRIGPPTEEDFVDLDPSQGVGRDLAIGPDTYYDLSQPGDYTIAAHWVGTIGGEALDSEAIVVTLSAPTEAVGD